MQITRWILRFICSAVFLVIGIYSFLALIIAMFILTGTLTPGDVMFYDSTTPTLTQSLVFAGIGAVAAAAVGFMRHKLSPGIRHDHSSKTGGA